MKPETSTSASAGASGTPEARCFLLTLLDGYLVTDLGTSTCWLKLGGLSVLDPQKAKNFLQCGQQQPGLFVFVGLGGGRAVLLVVVMFWVRALFCKFI